MKKFMPYLLPVITFLAIGSILFINPDITGSFVKDISGLNAEIKISTYRHLVMPEETVVEIWLDDVSSRMTYKDFIDRTKEDYELEEGKFEDINYEGVGYTGNYEYFLPISEFGFDVEKGQTMRVKVIYENYLISESVIPIK